MKLNHKLVLVSAAVLMGVSPVLGMTGNGVSVQAAPIAHAKGVHNTYGKNSRVKMTKTMKFVDRYGKKTSKTATKGGHYTVWNVKNIDGEVYYSIQTDLKYWIPAAATEGTVTYKSGKTTYTLKSNGKKVVTSTSTAKSVKKTTKKTVKKSESKKDSKKAVTKKVTKKNNSKKSNKIKAVKISMKKKTYVYDNAGKRVKNYLGTSYIGKGITVKGLGTKTIKGTKYYALKPNHYYVKASDVTVK